MATHSSVLVWRIPLTEEPGGYSPWGHKRVRHSLATEQQYIFAAAAAKSLQLFPTLRNPIDGSPPGFLSLGFSRQEHWSGLPFPSPMCERKSESEVA